MTNTSNTGSDITWLKSLAEDGLNTPLQAGPYLVAGGSWFGAASGLLTVAQLGFITLPESIETGVWFVAVLGFVATLFLLIRRDHEQGEAGYNRLVNATWSAAGFGIFSFWISAMVLAARTGEGLVMTTVSLAVLSIYGLVWWMKGTLTGALWMKGVALLSFLSTFPIAVAVGTSFAWLTYTAALAACILAPGIYLMRVRGRVV